jgi:hypothetical protein
MACFATKSQSGQRRRVVVDRGWPFLRFGVVVLVRRAVTARGIPLFSPENRELAQAYPTPLPFRTASGRVSRYGRTAAVGFPLDFLHSDRSLRTRDEMTRWVRRFAAAASLAAVAMLFEGAAPSGATEQPAPIPLLPQVGTTVSVH